MKPEEIKVGQLYTNKEYPEYIYLGAGDLIPHSNGEYGNKKLVCITRQIGHTVVPYHLNPEFWDNMVPLFGKTIKIVDCP